MTMLPSRRFCTSYDADDRLLVAIVHNDLDEVRSIVASPRYRSLINTSLYFRSHRHEGNHPLTLLAAACHYGAFEIVDLLINQFHANINHQHLPNWQTALHHAVLAKCHRFEIVQFLVRNGAQVDALDRHGTTALMLAVLYSHGDVVQFLVEQAGANVRLYNQYHFTALDFVKSNLSILNDLIRHGALLSNSNANLHKLFHWLLINKHRRFARLLIEAGYTPLKHVYAMRTRSLKSLCRLEIRQHVSARYFREQIHLLPVRNRYLIKYILLDEI